MCLAEDMGLYSDSSSHVTLSYPQFPSLKRLPLVPSLQKAFINLILKPSSETAMTCESALPSVDHTVPWCVLLEFSADTIQVDSFLSIHRSLAPSLACFTLRRSRRDVRSFPRGLVFALQPDVADTADLEIVKSEVRSALGLWLAV